MVMHAEREWDSAVGRAIRVAAAVAAPAPSDKSFLEKRLAAALGDALEAELAPLRVSLNKKLPDFELPNWDPQPGWLDVSVVDESERLLVVAEIKLDDVDQTLWDIFKVAAALDLPSVQAAYVIVAAPLSTWRTASEVVELFSAEAEKEWASRYLFDAYRKSWTHLLRGGRARPTKVAATLRITPLARVPVDHFPPYELRAVRIHPYGDHLALVNGWPERRRGDIDDEEPRFGGHSAGSRERGGSSRVRPHNQRLRADGLVRPLRRTGQSCSGDVAPER